MTLDLSSNPHELESMTLGKKKMPLEPKSVMLFLESLPLERLYEPHEHELVTLFERTKHHFPMFGRQ